MKPPIRDEPPQQTPLRRHHIRVPLGLHGLALSVRDACAVRAWPDAARAVRGRVELLGLFEDARFVCFGGAGRGGAAEGMLVMEKVVWAGRKGTEAEEEGGGG